MKNITGRGGSARRLRASTLSGAMSAIPADAHVVASPYCSTPSTLLAALGDRAMRVSGVTLTAGLLLGDLGFASAVRAGDLRFRTWHVAGGVRKLASEGHLDYVPARAHDIAQLLRGRVDVAIVRLTPPDRHGRCSLGPSASYTKAALEQARVTIAEVDPLLPWTFGSDVTVELAAFDHVVETESLTPTFRSEAATPLSQAIADHLVPLIKPGSALQLGIGAVPGVVASAVARADLHDLRIIGMVSDAMIDLLEAPQLSTSTSAVTAVEILGSERLFKATDHNRSIVMRSSQAVHNPVWLSQYPRLVSVCSALAVDLTGQVASEEVAGRMIAGVGGSADFFEGAGLSPGGLRIVALPSTTPSGHSRITRELGSGTPVTLPRYAVDVVVTEYGVARLHGRTLAERAEALREIAAPEHRDGLTRMTPNHPVSIVS